MTSFHSPGDTFVTEIILHNSGSCYQGLWRVSYDVQVVVEASCNWRLCCGQKDIWTYEALKFFLKICFNYCNQLYRSADASYQLTHCWQYFSSGALSDKQDNNKYVIVSLTYKDSMWIGFSAKNLQVDQCEWDWGLIHETYCNHHVSVKEQCKSTQVVHLQILQWCRIRLQWHRTSVLNSYSSRTL